MKEFTKSSGNTKENKSSLSNSVLVLFNDDINSYDFVIKTLIEVCNHDHIQAEQCTFIIHYKGKCDVKKGSFDILKPMKDSLIDRGLNATIA